ncbi:MAG: response regulator, partial [candidate division KSB1 bacterium]|nr:response regulator [candidate division KSB1 bacterium]
MNEVRLLLADKNLSYLEIARKMLRFHDEAYKVDVALTGQECLEKLNQNQYDLLLLDYDIDDKKGLEVLSRIIDKKIDVPVVMLVDEGREEIAHKALEKGAYDYIMKVRGYLTALPFTVGKVLEKKRQRIITPVLEEQPVEEESLPQYAEAADAHPYDDTEGHLIETEGLPDLEVEDREAYFILDNKGRFITTNPKLEEMLKYSEEELLELNLSDLIPAQKENEYYRWLTKVDLSSQEQSFRTELVGKYGDQQLAEIILSPMRDRDNEVISYKGKIKIIVPDNGSAHPSH